MLALLLHKLPEWEKLRASDDEERAGTSEMEMFFKVKIESENVTWRMRRKKTASFCPLPPPISAHASTSAIITFMGCHLKTSMHEGISRALSLGCHLMGSFSLIFQYFVALISRYISLRFLLSWNFEATNVHGLVLPPVKFSWAWTSLDLVTKTQTMDQSE